MFRTAPRIAVTPSIAGVIGLVVVIVGSLNGWSLSRLLAVVTLAMVLTIAVAWIFFE